MTRRTIPAAILAAAALVAATFGSRTVADSDPPFPKIVNTQDPTDRPPTPEAAVKKITVPPGFRVSLFAGEPDVHQPIAMHIDDRGRLWVAECFTYSGKGGGNSWDVDQRDRLLIFEDTDNDGTFDRKKVFTDRLTNLTSVTTGFGGVWVLCAPQMLFIPDRDGDDVPDHSPQVLLDGWAVQGVGHNIVNGLLWGPDGWLYGRHGIMATSHVGTPGTPPEKRVKINCGIWRYHPTRKVFEDVCHGTTNPWGMDYNDHGQMFFTNNVIGHLWHVIPGAHYKRMYGEDLNPHVYELIEQHADHHHWDTGKAWHESRDGKGKNDELGGGHSHCGGMIYLGDNWPEKYRDTIFMCNTHGRRVNNDRLVRHGSGYVAKHEKDFLFANNPWFRGIDLKYGPDGGVYLSDWVDLGECHDHDGVHRTSGQIYKVTFGTPPKPKIPDFAKLSDAELVKLQLHRNDWYVRVSRRVLQERAAAGKDMTQAHAALHKMFEQHPDVTRKLRAMWCLYVTGGTTEQWLTQQLSHSDEHVSAWAIRLLVDGDRPSPAARLALLSLADREQLSGKAPAGLVRLFLASALRRLPLQERAALAAKLLQDPVNADDHNLPLLIWYGIEPLVATDAAAAEALIRSSKIPLVRQFIARRRTQEMATRPEAVAGILKVLASNDSPLVQRDILQGMADAMKGWRKAPPPAEWQLVRQKLSSSDDKQIHELVRNLSVVFGDGRAVAELRKIALDTNADGAARRSALQVLIDSRPDDLLPLLTKLLGDRATVKVAVKGLAGFDDARIPGLILERYNFLSKEDRPEAIAALVSRPAFAKALLDAVKARRIDRGDITAFHARQILSLNDKSLAAQLSEVWGELRSTPAEKKQLIAKYRKMLTKQLLQSADLKQGRLLFQKVCGNCHRLYGEGEAIGPDLTGSNRYDLGYLLENIIDPNAVVPADFRMSVVELKNGRVLTGVAVSSGKTVTVQTQNEKLTLPRDEIASIRATPTSLMPEGILTPLSDREVRDLIAYTMSQP